MRRIIQSTHGAISAVSVFSGTALSELCVSTHIRIIRYGVMNATAPTASTRFISAPAERFSSGLSVSLTWSA
jgi:hypothetical protein